MDKETGVQNCVLCACKHGAKAKAFLLEAKLGYPSAYWDCLANLSMMEDHLVNKYPSQARIIRSNRKELETYPNYDMPWEDIIMSTALLEGYDLEKLWPVPKETESDSLPGI